MRGYGQYCPISRAAEVLGDRWTINLVRDLLTGATRFNELVRSNPGLSRGLLSRRLDQLQRAGIVAHDPDGAYRLTTAGQDLRPVVFGLAEWGARYAFGDPRPDELDPDLLLWWLHQALETGEYAGTRAVVAVELSDHPNRYWIVIEGDEASICRHDPGFEVELAVRADRATLYRVYLGRDTLLGAVRRGDLTLQGPSASVARFHRAFTPSPVAEVVARGAAAS